MTRQPLARSGVLRFAPLLAVLLVTEVPLRAEDGPESPEKRLAQERLELMQQRIGQFSVMAKSNAPDFPKALQPKPIFRYDDPARGYVAAALWQLGESGRPLAIISTELQPKYRGVPRIVYEYLSLTDQPFSATSPDYQWTPEQSALEFKPIPGSSTPAETPALRLVQMRTETRRFTAFEMIGQNRTELRLMPQPISRYVPTAAERADGAIFVLAFGTNPEALLFLESDGKAWQFAIGRLAGTSLMRAQIDGQDVWEIGRVRYLPTESYTASNAAAKIPGIDADGNLLPTP